MKTPEEYYKEYFDTKIIPSEVNIDTIFILKFAEYYHSNALQSQTKVMISDESLLLHKRLQEGRDYLMSVQADEVTVEDALEAFGFGRSGLQH